MSDKERNWDSEFESFEERTVAEKKFKYKGKEYLVREASAGANREYRNACMKYTQIGGDGKPTKYEGMANVESLLVSHCVFSWDSEENEIPVPEAVILTWPHRMVDTLYEWIKEVSEMSIKAEDADEDEEQLGNVPKSGTDGLESAEPSEPSLDQS